MFKRFISLLTLALVLASAALSLFTPTSQTADAASGIAYYVDYSSHYSIGRTDYPREYQYSSSNAPKSSWGTLKKPFVGIASAIDAAAHHGKKSVTIYYCMPRGTSSYPTWSWNARVRPYTSKKLDVHVRPYPAADLSQCRGGKNFDSQHEFNTNNYKTLSIEGFKQTSYSPLEIKAKDAEVYLQNWVRFYGNSSVTVKNAKSIHFKNNKVIENSTAGMDMYFETNDGGIYISNNSFSVAPSATSVGMGGYYSDYSAIFAYGAPNGKIQFQNNDVENYQFVAGGEVGVISGNNFEFTRPYSGAGGPIKSGQITLMGGSSPTNVSEIRNNTFKTLEKGSIHLKGNVNVNSIHQNQFESMDVAAQIDPALYQEIPDGHVQSITENEFINFKQGLELFYVDDVLRNRFSAPGVSSTTNVVHASFVGEVLNVRENDFPGGSPSISEVGIAVAPASARADYYAARFTTPTNVNDIGSNRFKDLEAGVVVNLMNPSGVKVNKISQNVFDDVKRGIFLDKVDVDSISSNQMDGEQFGIHCAIDCVTTNVFTNHIDNYEHSIEIIAGTMENIYQNRFTDYLEGIFIEAYEGMTKDYYTADSFPTVTHHHLTNIRENEFENQEWGDTIAISAAGNGTMGDIEKNRYTYTEQFLVSIGELEWGDIFHNEYLSTPTSIPGGSHVAPAVFVDASKARFLENFFHLAGGPVYDTVYDLRDAEVEVAYHYNLKANDTAISYSGSGPYSTSNANVSIFDNRIDAPQAIVVDGAASFDKTIEIENNEFQSSVNTCVNITDKRSGREIFVRNNDFYNCPTAVMAERSRNIFVEKNIFRYIPVGVFADNSELDVIQGNDFIQVDNPIVVDQGVIPAISANRIDTAVEGVLFNNTDWGLNQHFYNNTIARSATAVQATGVGTTASPDAYFQFNTFYDNGTDLDLAGSTSVFYYIVNNIFSETPSLPMALPSNALDYDVSNNLFRSIDPASTRIISDSTTNHTLDSIEAFCTSSAGPCSYHHDNEFDSVRATFASTGNFQPNYDSYAIDNGTNSYSSFLTEDITGGARERGGNPDIGAYERNLSYDTDGDGLWDEAEVAWGSDILLTDSDGDGDNDGDEVLFLRQDPSVADIIDTDGDGMDDSFEDLFSLDKNDPSDASDDNDGDGATNLEEYYYWRSGGEIVDPTNVDSDGDGIWDGWEIEAADACGISYVDPSLSDATNDVDADGLDNAGEYAEETNPCTDDTDADALLDGDEVNTHGTDPLSPDTDGDGLTDGEEINGDYGVITDAFDIDTDSDGLSDYEELVTYASTYTGPDAPLDPTVDDTDGDGFLDGLEVNSYSTDPTDASDYPADADGDGLDDVWEDLYACVDSSVADASDDDDSDGLTHLEEATYGTDPCDAHSDADAWDDGYEVNTSGTDPLLADTDTDSVNDDVDACPLTAAVSGYDVDADGCTDDTDGDGTTDDIDTDDDNDGLSDADEATAGTDPLVEDTDGDGYLDGEDDLPLDSTEWLDTDGDGTGNNSDTDDDNDGTLDTADAFPLDDSADTDTDGDGFPDTVTGTSSTGLVEDTDDDNDGVLDTADSCPLVAYVSGYDVDGDGCTDDTDGDGTTDDLDLNDDGDGYTDSEEAALGTDPLLADTDGDGFDDHLDAFPLDSSEWADADSDGVGDNSDACPGTPSSATVDATGCADTDADGISDTDETAGTLGEVTDPNDADSDDDGLTDYEELVTYASSGVSANDDDSDDDGLNDYEELVTYASTYTCLDPVDDDSDSDGLLDAAEISAGSSPCLTDTDSDGLDDVDEVNTYGTNPASSDTDGDGLSDYEELVTYASAYTGSYAPLDPLNSDTDGDGLNDGDEVNTHGTDPTERDTDSDGLTDYQEVVTYASTYTCLDPNVGDTDSDDLLDGAEINTHGTNPCSDDMDSDGLLDGEEVNGDYGYVTDPTDSDSDADGLTDGDEVLVYSTDPNDEDSDDDGLSDYAEVITYASSAWSGLGWTGADMGTATYLDPNDDDSDGDSVLDGDEVAYGTDPTDSSSYSLDADGDGVVDSLDLCASTPTGVAVDSDGCPDYTVDTDGDGFTDGYEVDEGTDATSSSVYPSLDVTIVGYNYLEGYGSTVSNWTDVSTIYTSTNSFTINDILSEDLYLSAQSTSGYNHTFGVKWNPEHFLGTASGYECGGGSGIDGNAAAFTCVSSFSSTAPSSLTNGSSLSGSHTLADFTWFEVAGSGFTYDFMKARIRP